MKFLLLIVALFGISILQAQTNKYTGCADGTEVPAIINIALETDVFERVNGIRAGLGVPPLKRVAEFDNSARYHAKDMGDDNYFDHQSFDRVSGNLAFICSTFTRVGKFYNWSTEIAENIGAGTSDPASMMDSWINSPGHYENMIDANSWEFGIGYYFNSSSDFQHYWCQNFGVRADVYPLVINYDSSVTTTRNVRLYLYGTGVFDEMRLKNDLDSWGAWQPFQANVSWTLSSTQGNKTVDLELRKLGTSASAASSDIIEYDIFAGFQPLLSSQVQSSIAPNPFKNSTKLSLVLSESQQVTIELYSLAGKLVVVLNKGKLGVGAHFFDITPPINQSIWICRIQGEHFTEIKKLFRFH